MATSHCTVAEVQVQHGDITDCSICHKTVKDPRILSCVHTFCLVCISQEGTKNSKRSEDKMPCPECRKEFTVPIKGFEGLQKNFFMQRLIEIRNSLQETSAQIPCDTCNDENNESGAVATAAMHCLDCHLNLCERCCAHHRKSRLTTEHTLRDGASMTIARESEESLESRLCRRHKDEEMKLYCKKCLEVLCPMCFIENHQGHERSSVTEAGDVFRKKLQIGIKDLEECTAKTTIKKEIIEREKDRIIKRTKQLEKDVMKRRDELKKLVDERAKLLLEQLRTREREKLNEVAIEDGETERHLVSLERHRQYCSSVVKNGTDSEICRMVYDLNARAIELHKDNDATVQHLLTPYQLSLTATILDNIRGLVENIIGKIEDTDNEELELIGEENLSEEKAENSGETTPQPEQRAAGKIKFRSKAVLVQSLQTKQQGRPIWGLTVMDNELFIVVAKSSNVEIYEALSYNFKRQWGISSLTNPQDIVSCASKKCLFIVNWDNGCNSTMIVKVDPNGKVLTHWSMKISGGRLSIKQELTVIVSAYEKNKFYEYSLDGEFIKELKLHDKHLCHLQHIVKLTNDRFLVCSGGATDLQHMVCLMDQRGNILKSFGGERGSGTQSLNRPLHLAVDGDGYIFVADWNNRRVLLLNSDLKFQTELVTRKDGLKNPGRIFLDQSNNRLLLANNVYGYGPGDILIFDISQELR